MYKVHILSILYLSKLTLLIVLAANPDVDVHIIELNPNDPDPLFSSEEELEDLSEVSFQSNTHRQSDRGRFLLVKSIFGCPSITQYFLTNHFQHLTILSPNYPLQYPLSSTCRYAISSPPGTRMAMVCHVALPHQKLQFGNPTKFKFCQKTGDSFIFSLNGDDQLRPYNSSLCGHFLLKSVSVANKLAIGYTAGQRNIFSYLPTTRKFKCKIKIVKKLTGSDVAQNFSCGRRFQRQFLEKETRQVRNRRQQGRILGGTLAARGEFPWRCALQVIMNGVVSQTCSCSILNNDWILSSVHCTINQNTADVFIRVGQSTFRVSDPGLLSVSDIRRHPAYGTAGPHGDISVLKLSQPLVYSPTVSPICVSCSFDYDIATFNRARMTVSGWVEAPTGTFNLLWQELTRQDQSICQMLTPVPVDGNEICIIDPGKMTCVSTGDSGSDADYQDPITGSYFAAGIFTSSPCMSQMMPGIHQNINHYLPWLRQQTGIDFCGSGP